MRVFRQRQTGQSMIEYVVVVAFAIMVLLYEDASGKNTIEKVADAIKGYYRGYAYAISLSELPAMVSTAELIQFCLDSGRSQTECDNSVQTKHVVDVVEVIQGKSLPALPDSMPKITGAIVLDALTSFGP